MSKEYSEPKLENELNCLTNRRLHQFVSKWKTKSVFGNWKTTSILGHMKDSLFFWANERGPRNL